MENAVADIAEMISVFMFVYNISNNQHQYLKVKPRHSDDQLKTLKAYFSKQTKNMKQPITNLCDGIGGLKEMKKYATECNDVAASLNTIQKCFSDYLTQLEPSLQNLPKESWFKDFEKQQKRTKDISTEFMFLLQINQKYSVNALKVLLDACKKIKLEKKIHKLNNFTNIQGELIQYVDQNYEKHPSIVDNTFQFVLLKSLILIQATVSCRITKHQTLSLNKAGKHFEC